ncbi:MAG TPA: hypothetical protein VIH28_07105 [Ignavibacteriaceae bacterium]
MEGLNFIEKKGDVTFLADAKGRLFQQIGSNEPFKVKEGKISYRHISTKNGIEIKYNTNGVWGFTLFKREKAMEDNIWTLAEAERISEEIR